MDRDICVLNWSGGGMFWMLRQLCGRDEAREAAFRVPLESWDVDIAKFGSVLVKYLIQDPIICVRQV
jgi:hypothetical protein